MDGTAWAHIRATAAEDQSQHSSDSQPLRDCLDEDAAGEAHELGMGRSLVVYTVKFGLLKGRARVDNLGRGRSVVAGNSMRLAQRLAPSGSRAARHVGEATMAQRVTGVVDGEGGDE